MKHFPLLLSLVLSMVASFGFATNASAQGHIQIMDSPSGTDHGADLTMSGDTMVSKVNSGIEMAEYRLIGDTWTLNNIFPRPFGAPISSLKLRGRTLFAGSGTFSNGVPFAGAAFVQDLDTGTWLNPLQITGHSTGDGFGLSLAANPQGNKFVSLIDGFSGNRAIVFENIGGNWQESTVQYVPSFDSDGWNNNPAAIAMSDTEFVVGVYNSNAFSALGGAVLVFNIGTGNEYQLPFLSANPNDGLGVAVAIDGNRIAATSVSGRMLIWEKDLSGTWQYVTEVALQHPSGINPVELQGDLAIVGTAGATVIGAVESYRLNHSTGNWELQSVLNPEGGSFGIFITLDQSERFAFGHYNEGNGKIYVSAGPEIGTVVCPGTVNSTGQVALQAIVGNSGVASNDIRLFASNLPADAFCVPVAGQGTQQVLIGQGTFCLGGSFTRTPVVQANAAGFLQVAIDLTTTGNYGGGGGPVLAGQTWRFQTWFREGPTSNFTSAIEVIFN